MILTIIIVLVSNYLGDGGSGPTSGVQQGGVTRRFGGENRVQQQLAACRTGADTRGSDVCLIKATVATVEAFWTAYLPETTGTRYSAAVAKVYSGSTRST